MCRYRFGFAFLFVLLFFACAYLLRSAFLFDKNGLIGGINTLHVIFIICILYDFFVQFIYLLSLVQNLLLLLVTCDICSQALVNKKF